LKGDKKMDKENSVSTYLQQLIGDKVLLDLRKKGEEKRMTIILSEYDYNRLITVSDYFAEKPSIFARNLLNLSLDDAEKIIKLAPTE
jgi:hypothetical protein